MHRTANIPVGDSSSHFEERGCVLGGPAAAHLLGFRTLRSFDPCGWCFAHSRAPVHGHRALLAALRDVGYRGPIGLMCYGVPGDPRDHLARWMRTWRKLPPR